MDVRVEIIREASEELVEAFSRLLPQLSTTAHPLDYEAVDRMVTCDANTMLVARTSDAIVGTLTLVLLPLPSGLRARVEDVVVDSTARGRGVAGGGGGEGRPHCGGAGAPPPPPTHTPTRPVPPPRGAAPPPPPRQRPRWARTERSRYGAVARTASAVR
ncbi:GNAT family N-acetyltransferase, partial [Streptomyces sp. NPDC059744]|uniref:GNAT family N-acetyltransferase n=1 Tax=Streptomyces sp. NPDC059744 TaxID=3346929 RepID=UPI0036489529